MKMLVRILSAIALGLTVIPSILVFVGNITWQTHADLMLGGTVLWFVTAPYWMKKD